MSREPTLRGSNAGLEKEEDRTSDLRDSEKGIVTDAAVDQKGGRRPSWRQSMQKETGFEEEDPFGDEDAVEGGVKYRTMTWCHDCGNHLVGHPVSTLGPSHHGLGPGAALILGLGGLATYIGYVIGQFKNKYPFVHNMHDAGRVLFRPLGPKWEMFGREFLGAAQVIFLVFTMGSHILTWTICLDTLTDHATCALVWGVIGFAILWLVDLPRTLKHVSYWSIASCFSIFTAVLITMIDVGITNPGRRMGGWSNLPMAGTKFQSAFLSVTNIVFAYAGHVAFFSFISEFKNPREFPKALFLLQFCDTAMYLIAGMVIYRFGGEQVVSPALGAAAPPVNKVAWGIAIPTIIIAAVIYGHVAAKYIYVRIFRGTKHMHRRTLLSYGSWALITLVLWLIAWIIAESIPVFNDLLALITSLFASWFTYGISGIFWLFMNWGNWFHGPRKIALTCLNFFTFALGATICGLGLYVSGYAITQGSSGGSWSCTVSSS